MDWNGFYDFTFDAGSIDGSDCVLGDQVCRFALDWRIVALLNGSEFLEYFLSYRLIGVFGRLGAHKTSFAVYLARWLWLNGFVDGVFSNIPIDPEYVPVLDHCFRACIVLDETASFADSRNSGSKWTGYGAYARKLESFWISPSKNKPDKRLTDIVCRRVSDIWLLDALLYKWRDQTDESEEVTGWFLWSEYQETYGHYATDFIPADDGGILDTMFAEIKERSGSTRRIWIPGESGVYKPQYSLKNIARSKSDGVLIGVAKQFAGKLGLVGSAGFTTEEVSS